MDRVSARSLVELWLKDQEGLSQSTVSHGNNSTADWAFNVTTFVPEVQREFNILKVVVEDGTVRILRDSREAVEKVLQSPSGFAREDQLFQAFKELGAKYPDWFVNLKRSGAFSDRHGIDGWAVICIPGVDTVNIPFQIKSSKGGVRHFFTEHPWFKEIIISIVVKESSSAQELRTRLLQQLGNSRAKIIRGEYSLAEFKQRITDAISRKLI